MLLVRTYLASSPIDGIGLFVAESIAKDTVIWAFDPRIDRLFSPEERERFPEPLRTFLGLTATRGVLGHRSSFWTGITLAS